MVGSASAVLACARAVDAGRDGEGEAGWLPVPLRRVAIRRRERVQASAGGAESAI